MQEGYYKIPTGRSLPNENYSKYFLYFPLDVFIELQNTTREARMVRDFRAFLVKDDKIISPLIQSSGATINKANGNVKKIDYGNKGSYSFFIAP